MEHILTISFASSVGSSNGDRPPICPRGRVTTVPAALSADETQECYWVCLECEELGEDD
jgi:hypothetical protein